MAEIETQVHDVMNVFMCTGFTRDTGQYFMKASPVRLGDFIEFFAEIDLMGALSACPGGDCSTTHSSDVANCYPLKIEVFASQEGTLGDWQSPLPRMGMIAAMVVRPSLRSGLSNRIRISGRSQAGAGLRITWNAITAADPIAALR